MVPVRRNQNWLPSIFNDFLGNDWLAERHNTTAPAVNIIEDENEYKVEVAAPGMTKDDLENEEAHLKAFEIYVDGELKASTDAVFYNTPMQKLSVDVTGAKTVTLVGVSDEEPTNVYTFSNAPATWADAKFIR